MQSSPPGLCVCSEEKREARVTNEAVQVLACPLLLDADCKVRKQPGLSRKEVCVRVRSLLHSESVDLTMWLWVWTPKASRETPSSPPTESSFELSLHLTCQRSERAPAGINQGGLTEPFQVRFAVILTLKGEKKTFIFLIRRGILFLCFLRGCNGLIWHLSRCFARRDPAGFHPAWPYVP